MPMNCDILFSYSNKREYIGAINFRSVVGMEVQHVFDASGSNRANPTGMPPLITGAYTGVIVNGINFGTGKIISYSNPTSTEISENGRHLWKQIVRVEVYQSGNSGNLGSSPALTGLSIVYNPNLESFDESFGFDISQQGDYQYTHSASIKCSTEPSGGGESGYSIARRIASGLLVSVPPLGYIDAVHSGLYTGIGQRLYSENIDILNGTAEFEEKLIIQNRDFFKHSVSFDNGFINITENGSLRHSGISTASGVFMADPLGIKTRYNNSMGGAWARCNSLWTTYSGFMGEISYATNLETQPFQTTRAFDETSQEFTYSVTYTNNPNMTTSGYTIDRELNFSLNTVGNTEATEQGSITAYAPKGTTMKGLMLSGINGEMATASTRLTSYWASIASCKLIAESKNFSIRGKKASYLVTYSNDPSFLNDGTYLTRTIAIQDNGAVLMHSPYFIIGRSSPLMHNPGQTQFGSATCSISATLPKPTGYYAGTPIKPTALNQMFIDSVNSVISKISICSPLDMYISKVTYLYNSDMTAELTTEAQYVYARTDKA